MSDPIPSDVLWQTPLDRDQPCIKCGYSLRGLAASGVCPECATPVERSLRGDFLVYSDPAYLQGLVRGAQMVHWSIIGWLVSFFAVLVVSVSARAADLIFLVGFIVLSGLFLSGCWSLTVPDLGQLSTNTGEVPRRLARIATASIASLLGADFMLSHYFAGAPRAVGAAISLLTYVAVGLGAYAGMKYLRWLTPRIPDATAQEMARKLARSMLALIGLMLAVKVYELIVRTTPAIPRSRRSWVSVLDGITGIWSLVVFISFFNLHSRIRADLLRILGEQKGAEEPAPSREPRGGA